jgi:adenylate cyclase
MVTQEQPTQPQETGNEELWRTIFADGHPDLKKQHALHRLLPRDPRCRMCLAPFSGLGGWWMGRRGKKPSSRNPHYCSACDGFLDTFPGGAEVEMSILFVDIRNSTEYARNAKPADVQARVSAFLDAATRAITENDGFLMAFYGDCVVAVWPPGFSGPDHADKALKAARALIRPGLIPQNDAPVELGVGLHRGPVFIGTVSAAKGLFRDVSIFGSEVILCARLASDAAPGQVLATEATAATGPAAPRALKGFDTPVNVLEIGD